jgi:hypothetical protein
MPLPIVEGRSVVGGVWHWRHSGACRAVARCERQVIASEQDWPGVRFLSACECIRRFLFAPHLDLALVVARAVAGAAPATGGGARGEFLILRNSCRR